MAPEGKSTNPEPTTSHPIDEASAAAKASRAAKNKRKKDATKQKRAEAIRQEALEKEALEKGKAEAEKAAAEKAKSGGVPAGACFEIKPTPGKGLGLFTTRALKAGEELVREAPLLKGGSHWVQREATFIAMSDATKKKFLALQARCLCKKIPCQEREIQKFWQANGFEQPNQSQLKFIYEIASRINHACEPTAEHCFTPEGTIIVTAIKDIKKGWEITSDFIGASGSTTIRRGFLMNALGFRCCCIACTAGRDVSPDNVKAGLPASRLVPDDATAVVLGKPSPEDIKAEAQVEENYAEFVTFMEHLRFQFETLLSSDISDGKSTYESHGSIFKATMIAMKNYFIQKNKFGLGDDIMEEFLRREEFIMAFMANQILGCKEF